MKNIVEYIGSFVICSVGLGVFQYGDAGKTLNLPYYDVTFGSWPLMEVTKTGTFFKSRRNPKGKGPIGGPPRNKDTGYRLGPPPPGKLVLVNPGDKGALHQHLQANLKHFSNKKPVNLKLPIIVKAPGPHPPPPPPGYKLGPPSGPSPDGQPIKLTDSSSWKPGPPNPSQGDYVKDTGRKSRLFSILKNAAHSNLFSHGYDTYKTPEYYDQPPFPGPYITSYPDGSQVSTYVNDGFMSADSAARGVEAKPSVPPVLKIGGELPENYSLLFAERQIVGLKSLDTLEKSGNANPGTAEYNAAFKLGGNYEQGYGAPPPTKPPLLIQKFQKRGDHHVVEKLVTQELPDTGLISTTHLIYKTPNISAPLGGRNSEHFKSALEDKKRILKQRKKEQPLDAQVKLLGRLFTKLQRIKPPQLAVPEDEVEGGHGWGKDPYLDQEDHGGWKKKAKSKVDSPIMAVQIQTYSAPEINSADPDVVESMAEFGNHDVEFAETDELVNFMETLMNHGSSRVNLRDLGSNGDEINDNLQNWVQRHLALTRKVNHDIHSRGEEMASKQFRQYQTFVTTPGGGNGWSPSEPQIVDPKQGSRSIPNTLTHMGASFTPTP